MFPNLQQFASVIAAQAAPAPSAGGCLENNFLLMPVIMMAILYVVWILPARKERKTHATMLDALKRGDDIVTTSGILGTVADMTDKVITIEIAKNVKMRVLKTSIAKKIEEAKAEASPAKTDDKDAAKSSSSKETKASKT